MSQVSLTPEQQAQLRVHFETSLQEGVELAPYTSARIGGKADYLLEVRDVGELAQVSRTLWQTGIPFRILGGGSNLLVADEGVREVVVLNRARAHQFSEDASGLRIWAESGANVGALARLAAERGWSGMEWAATVPGTLGGAIVGNAGAHGSDMAESTSLAEILQQDGQVVSWAAEALDFRYRSSRLKDESGRFVVLSATLKADRSTPEACKARIQEYAAHRSKTQPPGASVGSMFKNPPGDYAGRLIDEAGLKGYRSGEVQISDLHANFFINHGGGTAADVWDLIHHARDTVLQQFGVRLELEVELIGAWTINNDLVVQG